MLFIDEKIIISPSNGENIVNRFSYEDWHLIASDVDDEKEWCSLLEDYPDFIQSYVLISKKENLPFAFFYLLNEYEDKRIVSFHGGGWNNSLYHTMLHFRSAFLIVKSLTEQGLKVRTYCKSYNEKAYRFLKEVGFIKYRLKGDTIEMYFSLEKMKRSKLYNKMFKTAGY